MRPIVRFLADDPIRQIIDETAGILSNLGLQIHKKQIPSMLSGHKSKGDEDNFHVNLTEYIVQKATRIAPNSFRLYDVRLSVEPDQAAINVCLRFSKDHRILVEPAFGAALSVLYDPVDEIRTAQSVLAIVRGGIGVSINKLVKWRREYATTEST